MASGVLRDVSNLKIARLVKQQSQFEEAKASLLKDAKNSPDSLTILVDGLKKLGLDGNATDASLLNLYLFKEQAKRDASIPRALTREWEKELLYALDAKSKKYEFTSLFAKLATEWADNPNDANLLLQATDTARNTSPSRSEDSETDDFEPVGREEMQKQRQEWDSYVFSERKTDTAAIDAYLLDLFSNTTKTKRVGQSPIEKLRAHVRDFGVDRHGRPHLPRCTERDVSRCVKGILQADLFTGRKRDALLDLVDARSAVLKEIADVINMEWPSLDVWQWQPSPVPTHMRRQLNGKYRVYMNPEIHQALLVYWIGIQFSVHLKTGFISFFKSGAWTSNQKVSMKRDDKARRKFYVDRLSSSRAQDSVRNIRRAQFEEDFFMTQLPSTIEGGSRDYGTNDSDGGEQAQGKSPMEVKQSLLHIATTEMLLQKKLYGKFTLVQTDFKWFGPSLPHSTIFAVLKFFHLSDYWIKFFEKFLTMPLVFVDDGPSAATRTRACGIPISHALSDALGEAVLFCLDFTVNKSTKGIVQLYRFHDDVWFWGQEEECATAWKSILSFSELMGLKTNDDKTGSFTVSDSPASKSKSSAVLPKGPVRWGFLLFNHAEGRWRVDEEAINEHTQELRRQLTACRSVLSEIQVWNSYVSRFFSNNFGQATNCLGRGHLDMVLSAFEKIQRDLFTSLDTRSNASRDITSYLKQKIGARFGVKEIDDAFLSFPAEYGGLDVRNPFIGLLALYEDSVEKPKSLLDTAFEEELDSYEEAKLLFETKDDDNRHADKPEGCDAKTFMPYEEYVRFREETSRALALTYEKLLDMPRVRGVEITRTVQAALQSIPAELANSKNISVSWGSMETYWKWVLQLYAKEAISSFGGLVLGERDMLPVELVKLLRSEKLRLQG